MTPRSSATPAAASPPTPSRRSSSASTCSGVERILIVPHTRCAMASNTEAELRERVGASAGQDASWQGFHVIDNQREALLADVRAVRSHPLIGDQVAVGGFMYDVDTGLLDQIV